MSPNESHIKLLPVDISAKVYKEIVNSCKQCLQVQTQNKVETGK